MNLLDHIVERERACGEYFGPFGRAKILKGAPDHIKENLQRGHLFPGLVAANQSVYTPLLPVGGSTGSFTAINTTVTETNLWNPALWAPIAANDMIPGKKYTVEFGGVVGTTATPLVSFRARCGTNNSVPPTGTDLGVSPTFTCGTFTAQPFYGIFTMVVRSIGTAASGATVTGNGMIVFPGAAAATTSPVIPFGGAVPTTVDNTSPQGLGVSVIWGTSSASNTLTCQWVHASSV